MEAALLTQQNARAYLYHAGLSTLGDEITTVNWQDNNDQFISQPAEGEFATPKATRLRTIIAESESGSVATFSAPHRFFRPWTEWAITGTTSPDQTILTYLTGTAGEYVNRYLVIGGRYPG